MRTSANAATDPVRRLRQAGVITGFVALVDPAAGGRHIEALVGVTLKRGVDSDAFAVAVSRLEPVVEVLLRTLRNRVGAADTETTIVLRAGPPQSPG